MSAPVAPNIVDLADENRILDLTALEVLAHMADRRISAAEYLAALLASCEAQKTLNAFIHLDADAAREAASRSDERRAANHARSLEGLPVVLKDNIHTATMPTTAGTPALRNNRSEQDAAVTARLVAAGAIILGKTNLHELAFGVTNNNAAFGPARNPYDTDRIPGASSGGTAVAVAARMAPVGVGTDTGGSVRIPASLCGIAGLRPTTLRWPQQGIVPVSHTRDTAGPMARSIADLALLDGVIVGCAYVETPAKLRGLRLGVPREHFWENLHADTAEVMDSALIRLREAGVVLVETDIPQVGTLGDAAGFPIARYEAPIALDSYLRAQDTGLNFELLVGEVASPDVKSTLRSLRAEAAIPFETYHAATSHHRPNLQRLFSDYFQREGVDAIVYPTTALPAAKIGEDESVVLNGLRVPTFRAFVRNTSPSSTAGLPGLTLPVGLSLEGLPIGLALDAPAGNDRRLLAIGLAIEAILPKLPRPHSI